MEISLILKLHIGLTILSIIPQHIFLTNRIKMINIEFYGRNFDRHGINISDGKKSYSILIWLLTIILSNFYIFHFVRYVKRMLKKYSKKGGSI